MIKHIGIAVDDVDKYIKLFESLGGKISHRGVATEYATECVFIDFGNVEIELIKGLQPDAPSTKFIEKYGVGLHHIAIEGEGDIQGAKPNMKVSFILKDKILIETVDEK